MRTLLLALILATSSASADLLSRFEYVADDVNHWQTAEETIARGYKGACEDYALLLKADLIAKGADSVEIKIVQGNLAGYGGHMVLSYDGIYYDTFGERAEYPEFTAMFTWSPVMVTAMLEQSK